MQGWYQDSGITGNDIVVFKPDVQVWVKNPQTGVNFVFTADGTAGHVARVKTATWHPNGTYTVLLAGAHNPNNVYNYPIWYSDAGCDDVDDLTWITTGSDPGGAYVFWHQ